MMPYYYYKNMSLIRVTLKVKTWGASEGQGDKGR